MPVTVYSEDEFKAMQMVLKRGAMTLSQKLCDAEKFPCIRGPKNSVNGQGDYCEGCPAHDECPFEFKQYPV